MKATLASTFAEIRQKKSLTLMDIGTKCDINDTTVLKIEQGKRSVRWETVHLVLSIGCGIQPGMEQYEACRVLWWKEREERAEARPNDAGRKNLDAETAAVLRQCRKALKGLSEEDVRRFGQMVDRFKPSPESASHPAPKTPRPQASPRGRKPPSR